MPVGSCGGTGETLGVEFKAALIPRDNTLRPDGAAVMRLIGALRQAHFMAGTPSLRTEPLKSAQVDDTDIASRLSGEFISWWNVEDHVAEGLTHPITPPYVDGDEGGYYALELHFSDSFVADANECVDPIDDTCICGNALSYWPDMDSNLFAARIPLTCPRCRAAFRPQTKQTIIRDGMTGEERSIMGGLTYRFAVVTDCGKSWPRDSDASPAILPAFKQMCETALGAPMYEVPYFY